MFYEYSGVAKGFGLIAVGAAFLLNPNVMGYIVADHVSLKRGLEISILTTLCEIFGRYLLGFHGKYL